MSESSGNALANRAVITPLEETNEMLRTDASRKSDDSFGESLERERGWVASCWKTGWQALPLRAGWPWVSGCPLGGLGMGV